MRGRTHSHVERDFFSSQTNNFAPTQQIIISTITDKIHLPLNALNLIFLRSVSMRVTFFNKRHSSLPRKLCAASEKYQKCHKNYLKINLFNSKRLFLTIIIVSSAFQRRLGNYKSIVHYCFMLLFRSPVLAPFLLAVFICF